MSYSGAKQTQEAREILGKALAKLQEDPNTPEEVLACAKEVAQAVGALFNAEKSNAESEGKSYVKDALNYMSQTLALLQNVTGQLPNVQEATQIIAQGMGALYPLTTLPTQREFQAKTSESSAPVDNLNPAEIQTNANTGTHMSGSQNLEVNIGVSTESNFYVGFSGDVREGGVFYATYESIAEQTPVHLHITLPGGLNFNAEGIVHFTREQAHFSDNSTPGIGIRFTQLPDQARQLAIRFSEKKPPLFFDN